MHPLSSCCVFNCASHDVMLPLLVFISMGFIWFDKSFLQHSDFVLFCFIFWIYLHFQNNQNDLSCLKQQVPSWGHCWTTSSFMIVDKKKLYFLKVVVHIPPLTLRLVSCRGPPPVWLSSLQTQIRSELYGGCTRWPASSVSSVPWPSSSGPTAPTLML